MQIHRSSGFQVGLCKLVHDCIVILNNEDVRCNLRWIPSQHIFHVPTAGCWPLLAVEVQRLEHMGPALGIGVCEI